MTGPESQRHPIEQLAEAFLERYRRGERPPLSEYVQQHPELADEIRDLFPALVLMEEMGPAQPSPPAACAGPVAGDGRLLERLGDYRLLREIGRGGMGVVYEAEQEALGRHVALKVLPPEAAGDLQRLGRFRREARSAARLHHSNIVPVHDVGVYQGVHYFAMQFIQGQGLDVVLREVKRLRAARNAPAVPESARDQAPPPNLTASLADGLLTGQFIAAAAGEAGPEAPQEPAAGADDTPPVSGGPSDFTSQPEAQYYRSVARVGMQVAGALAYAHAQKVLHRDVKLANLLLDQQGTVWVTDFGLAKDEGEELTRTGDVVGTLRYLPPERLSGHSEARGDVYSLGMTLYEMLTLRPAFEGGDRARLVQQITHEQPPRPRQLDPRVPRDLETIVLKAIEKEPGQRYSSAEALAEDLRRFLAGLPFRRGQRGRGSGPGNGPSVAPPRRRCCWSAAWRLCSSSAGPWACGITDGWRWNLARPRPPWRRKTLS
jgi:serine/threonine protein kinase